jgi:hypothetical protein
LKNKPDSFALFDGFDFGEFPDGRDDFAAFTDNFTHVAGVDGKSDDMGPGLVDGFINSQAVRVINDGTDDEFDEINHSF